LFHARYRTNPTALRKSQTPAPQTGTLVCELSFRPPLNWDAMLDFLSDRALPGVESVDRNSYYRTVALREHRGWIAVSRSLSRNTLRVELSASLAPALPPLLARLRRLFDLGADPELIAERLGGLAIDDPGMRLPGAFSGFETAVRAIIGQQISVRAANTLAGRLVESMGAPIESPFPALTRLSPTAERIARATPGEISAIGIVTSRANAIIALANAVIDRSLSFGPGVNIERTMARLKQIPGVGDWTAEYIAMRALSWPDAFPHTDLGIRKALGETNPARVLEMAEAWRPWRSYAVIRLWRSLKPLSPDTGSAM
ncbi:MAG TPA: DNA-3-methyladenine glycosylase 2, partial [Armatimonadota bacterium]|nr:DNA-3-methyladenine glycosylase 2 [Armatimonadota bacterium]